MISRPPLRHTSEVSERYPERQSASCRTVIEEAKAKVATIELADREAGPGKMRKIGAEWVTNCLIPDHEDRSPSFTVNSEKDVFWCHGCLRGGDVIELARYIWGFDKTEVATAAAYLLLEFGHDVPQKPAAWFARQERQGPVRDALEEVKVQHVQRRLFRIFLPTIQRIEDDAERQDEVERVWDSVYPIARQVVAGRMVR
jgi:DNA primase